MTTTLKTEILEKLQKPLVLASPQEFNPQEVAVAIQTKLNSIFGPFGWDQEFIEVFDSDKLFALKCTISFTTTQDNENVVYKKQQSTTVNRDDVHVYERLFIRTAQLLGVNTEASNAVDCSSTKITLAQEEQSVSSTTATTSAVEAINQNSSAVTQAQHEVVQPIKIDVETKVEPPPSVNPVLSAKDILNSRAGAHEPIKPGVYLRQENKDASTPAATTPDSQPVEAAEQNIAPLTDATIVDLPEAERKLVQEMLHKLETVSPTIVKTYITGPKGKERLTERSLNYLLSKISEKLLPNQ